MPIRGFRRDGNGQFCRRWWYLWLPRVRNICCQKNRTPLSHARGTISGHAFIGVFLGGLPRDTEIGKEYAAEDEIHWNYHRNLFILIPHFNPSVAIALWVSEVEFRALTSPLPPFSPPLLHAASPQHGSPARSPGLERWRVVVSDEWSLRFRDGSFCHLREMDRFQWFEVHRGREQV